MPLRYLMRFTLVALLLALSGVAHADAQTRRLRRELDVRFDLSDKFRTNDVTLYVRTTGVDDDNGCMLSGNPCKTIKHALDQIPEKYAVDVTVDLGPGNFDFPNYTLPEPGYSDDGEGEITLEGACDSPLATWTSVTPTLVPNRVHQVTLVVPGGWTGTVTDGSHYYISPTNGRPVRASTSPNLIQVTTSTSSQTGSLCAYETVINDNGTTDYVGIASTTGQLSKFKRLKFMGRSRFYGILLQGVSLASTSLPTLNNTALRGVYIAQTNQNLTMNGRFVNSDENQITDMLLESCVNLFGSFTFFGGVIKGTCTTQAQLWVGRFGTTEQVYGEHFIRNTTGLDFEGNGDCIRLNNADVRFGTAAFQGVTCNPSGTGRFAILDNQSTLNALPGQTISGTTTAAAQVLNGSFFNTAGVYTVVNSNVGVDGDFEVGATLSVLKAGIPVTDATHLSRLY